MALQRPTKLNPLIHLLTGLIDDTLINAISQSKITGLVSALLAKADLSGNNTFSGSNTFSSPLTVATATQNSHAATLAQVNAAVAGVNTAIHAPAASAAAARAIDATTLTDGEIINIAGTAGIWKWSAASTGTDDGVNFITPTNAGASGRFVFFLDQAVDEVTLASTQTITGLKTFSTSPAVPDATTSGQAASLNNVTSAIATEVTNRNTAIATETTNRTTAVTNEANTRAAADTAIQGGVGLSAAGAHVTSTGHYTSSATTIEGEIVALDAQVYTNTNNLASEITNRTTAVTNEASARAAADTAIENAVGLSAAGAHVTSTGHYTASATTIEGEILALDSQVYTNTGNVATNTSAISALQAAAAKVTRVVRLDSVAAGVTTLTLPSGQGLPSIPDDDSVQLWVNGIYWRKDTGGTATGRQFTVTSGGGSLTVFALDEVSDIEFRYVA